MTTLTPMTACPNGHPFPENLRELADADNPRRLICAKCDWTATEVPWKTAPAPPELAATPDLEWAVHIDAVVPQRRDVDRYRDDYGAALAACFGERDALLGGDRSDDDDLVTADPRWAAAWGERIKRASPDDLVTIVVWFEE